MVTYPSGGGSSPEEAAPGLFARTIFNSRHKTIGLRYLWLAFASVLLGMLLSLLMRIHIVWPGAHIPFFSALGGAPERYAALTILHASLMVFLVLTTAPQAGFGNYFLPLQIGAREMAFPLLTLFSFWATVVSVIGLTASFLVQPESGLTLWVASVALFCLSTLLTSINFVVTTLDLRAKGMTLPRMPLTVWAWFINAILSMLIFSFLLAACVFLLSDRLFGSQFFSPLAFLGRQSSSLMQPALISLWRRLFWFFAKAELYVAILPCFGFVSHLLSTFSRKPVWAERTAVFALCGVGLFGFCIWGLHMFSSGLDPWSPFAFSQLASSLGLPSCVLLVSWLGTLWKARIQLTTAMLFALGFVALFLSGGLSGLFLAHSDLLAASVANEFVTGHFHLVMGIAATFAIFAAFFFWFPKMFGRCLNETLGKLHFWLTLAGVYCVFLPMLWPGLFTYSRPLDGGSLAASTPRLPLDTFITSAALATVAVQALFFLNLVWTLSRTEKSEEQNLWRSTTLEWTVPSPPPFDNFGTVEPVIYRGAYEFRPSAALDFVSQNLPPQPSEISSQPQRAAQARSKET